jgi:C-terminal processing protease CtpA/Prc
MFPAAAHLLAIDLFIHGGGCGGRRQGGTLKNQRAAVAVGLVLVLLTVAQPPASARPRLGGDGQGGKPDWAGSGPVAQAAPRHHTAPATAANSDWCDHVLAGPAGPADIPVGWSVAHALVRAFSVDSAFYTADAALTTALSTPTPLTAGGLAAGLASYADHLGDVCALPARAGSLGPAQVRNVGKVAIITPGTGNLALPSDTTVAAIDLRGLPAVEGLDEALARALAPVTATDAQGATRILRSHSGPTDEWFVSPEFAVYSNSVTVQDGPVLAGSGARELPLVLLTERQMAPQAAAFAGALRMAGRAWLVGEDLVSEVAEASWQGVADHGLAVRTSLAQRVFAEGPPEELTGQVAAQDDPDDPSTATYRRDLQIDGDDAHLLDITVAGLPTDDLDLFLLHDADADGVFAFPRELAAVSAGPTADEHVKSGPLPAGDYQIWVHGWFVPGGETTFTLRTERLTQQIWPDVIPADDQTDPDSHGQIVAVSKRLARSTPPSVAGHASRTFPREIETFQQFPPVTTGRAEVRAGLVILHGRARMFSRYFGDVGDTIDERLAETLASVDAWDGQDRRAARNILRRFGEALHDGHQFTFDFGPSTVAGYLPVALDEIDGLPVVRTSAGAELQPGDTILSINGRPTADIYTEEATRTSAATHGYKFDLISREVSRLTGPVTLELRDPDGVVRSEVLAPYPASAYVQALDAAVGRPSGSLADQGAEDLYYLNLDGGVSPDDETVRAAIADAVAQGAEGMVVDMRGYPFSNPFEVAARLIREPFDSMIFEVTRYTGPNPPTVESFQTTLFPLDDPAFEGPIVLVTGPHAVSAAETFMQLLVGAERPVGVVGQQSAGTNGSLTGVSLPGSFGFTLTGEGIRNPDGSRFHGVGILPDVLVPLSAADFREGVDRDLLVAIDVLHGSR